MHINFLLETFPIAIKFYDDMLLQQNGILVLFKRLVVVAYFPQLGRCTWGIPLRWRCHGW